MDNRNGKIHRDVKLSNNINKAEKMLNEWIDETGVIDKGSSYYYEMFDLMIKCIKLGMRE